MRLRELTSETGASNNTNNPYSSTTTVKFRVRAKVSSATSA